VQVSAVPLHEPETATVQEALPPPLRPVQLQVPVEAL